MLRITRKEDWAHCPEKQNPADVGSRGELASKLKDNELWWKDPAWFSMLQREELGEAERTWIRCAQDKLKSDRNYNNLARKLKLEECDNDGILRCIGRLENSDLELELQQLIILPKHHKLSKLVKEECHRRTHHSGVRSTLARAEITVLGAKG